MFDILIMGGGINGAAVAREAAGRGLSVCLLEREDFGSGTTAASTRLIHGGLRYLRYGEVGLVREALREREILLATAPHLVRPLTFVLPVYEGSPYGPAQLRVGLWLYDRLARDRSLPGSRRLPPAAWPKWEPHLQRQGLRALLAYSDAQVDYPERLCLEYLLAAREQGAAIHNHTEVTALLRDGERVIGARARDRLTGEEREERARVVVNAAGPWVDRVNGLLPEPSAGSGLPRLIGAVKGSHLVLEPREGGPRHAVYSAARRDGRPFFIIPWSGLLLIGTTEVVEDAASESSRCTPEEIDYLLAETNDLFPALAVSADQIAYTYAGLRPLPASGSPAAAVTRRHFVVDHAAHGAPGLLSIVGGKLTTARSLAVAAVDAALHASRQSRGARREARGKADGSSHAVRLAPAFLAPRASRLAPCPLPGAVPDFAAFRTEEQREGRELGLSEAVAGHLSDLYGARAGRVRDLAAADPALARPLCPHSPVIGAQVRVAVEEEMARTLADVMLRRTPLGLAPCLGRDAAPAVARLMAALLGWDDARLADELAGYERTTRERDVC
jgi:glycerol-3-phosphate dehydrogenase